MKQFWKNHALSLILIGLFILSWGLQFAFQTSLVTQEALSHGEAFEWHAFWTEFGKDTFENWQSEFLQIFTFVMLTKWFIERGSHESRDGQDEMKAQLDRIEAKLGE